MNVGAQLLYRSEDEPVTAKVDPRKIDSLLIRVIGSTVRSWYLLSQAQLAIASDELKSSEVAEAND